MKKKILAILMATLTVGSLLSGCGGAQSGDANGNQESSKQESSDSEEPAEVVFAYMTQNNIPESSELERIQNLINDYTVDKINTKVKLVLFSNSDYMNQVNLMLASGEQIDLFQSLNTPHLKYMKDGTALDITAYLDDELKETKEIVYDKFLEPTTIEGKTYGIMNMGSAYVPGGFTYREDIAEELGIDMSQVTSPEDLTDVFAKVQEAYPSMVIIDPNRADSMFGTYLGSRVGFDGLGDSNTSNVSGVAYQGDATVVDIYETPEFKEVCDLARSWFEAGYYANDAATTTATTAELLMSGNCFGTFCGLGNPKIAQQYTNNYGHPFDNVKISDSLVGSGNTNAWMVNSSCENPSAACKFLNLLYTDAYVDNLLVYGEEGVDYKLDENGCVVAPDGYTDLNSVAYTDNMNYHYWGNKWLTYPVAGGLYGEEKEASKQQNYDAKLSDYYGFMYDYSGKEAEYTACQNIVAEYKKSLWVGAADVDETIAEMTKRLKAAGMDDLIQVKQEQLDKWMSNR